MVPVCLVITLLSSVYAKSLLNSPANSPMFYSMCWQQIVFIAFFLGHLIGMTREKKFYCRNRVRLKPRHIT